MSHAHQPVFAIKFFF